MVAFLQAFQPAAYAAPQGAQVVQGQVAIQPGLIQQSSDKAIINWQSFSIGAKESLRIQQPGVSSVLLNRVVGGDPSLILGRMEANGRVFLVNPRGIVFGKGSQVSVGSLVASTLDLSDTNFLAGNYRFSAAPGAGSLRADGEIHASDTVALVAPDLNVSGSIYAHRVGLGAGSTVQVDVEGDGLVLFNLRNDDDRDVALKVSGRVTADGGSAELRAQARGGAAGQVLNMDGLVQARGFSRQGGRIVIDGGTAGITTVNGRVDATGETGGSVTLLGHRLALTDAARVDASGRVGGGSLQVGGGFEGRGTAHNAERTWIATGAELRADAIERGDGGSVAIWADHRTDFFGNVYARGGRLGGNGGNVETSARQQLNMPSGGVDVSAAKGRAGQWLLDPNNIEISSATQAHITSSGSTVFESDDDSAILNVTTLNTALAAGATVTVQTAALGADTEAGDINVKALISPAGAGTLNLIAHGDISFTGSGGIAAGTSLFNVSLSAGGSVSAKDINTGGTLGIVAPGGASLTDFTSGDLSITATNNAITLGKGSVSGTLTASSGGGAISRSGAASDLLAVSSDATFTAGAGSITLGRFNSGHLLVNSAAGGLELGHGTVTGTLTATTTGGNITQASGGLTVTGAASLTSGAGAVTLDDVDSGSLAITSTNAAIQLGTGIVAGTLTVRSNGGAVTQVGTLTVNSTAEVTAGAGNITLDAANTFKQAVDLGGAVAKIRNAGSQGLTLGTVAITGDLTATTASGGLNLGGGSVGGALVATTTGGAISQGAALAVTGNATLTAGAASVTLGDFSSGNLLINTTGTAIELGTGTVTGTLTANSTGGNITQTGSARTVTSDATLTAGTGSVTLGTFHSGNLVINTTGTAIELGSGTVTGTLAATSVGGNITQTGSIRTVTGDATLSAGAGDVLLNAFSSHDLGITTANGDIRLGAGAVGGALTARSTGGHVTQAGALTVEGTAEITAGAGNITLDSANTFKQAVELTGATTKISNGGTQDLTLGTVTTGPLTAMTAGGALNLGAGSITGALSASSNGGAISQAGPLTVTQGATLDGGTGSVTLGSFISGNLGITTTNADIQLGTGTVTGTLTVASDGGAITQAFGGLTVTGAATLTSGAGSVTLDDFKSGNLGITSNNAAIQLGAGTVAGTLTVRSSGGAITQAGALTVNGVAEVTAGAGDITLDSANTFKAAVDLTGAIVKISNGGSQGLTLGNVLTTGTLTATTAGRALNLGAGSIGGALVAASNGGDISQGGALTVTGSATLTAGAGSVTLDDFDSGNLGITTTNGAIQLGTGTINGTLNASSSGGAITQAAAGTLTVTGDATLAGGTGSVTLGNFNSGNLGITTTNAAIRLGAGTVTGTLNASSSGGAITQVAGATGLTVTGASTLAAGAGDISLTNDNNHWGDVTLSGDTLDVHSAGDLNILGLTRPADRALTLRAGGNLTLAATTDINTGIANLSLTSLGGSFAAGGKLSGHDITVAAQTGLILGHDITAAGNLSLGTVNGGITQTNGDIRVTGTTTVDAGSSAIALTGTGNHFAGAVSLKGDVTEVTDNAALTLGTLATGDLTLISHGALNLGLGSVTGTLTATSNGGAITQTAALTLTGATTLDAGTADITLANAGNHLGGAITATGGAVSLRSATDLHLFALTQPANKALELQADGTLTLPAGTTDIDTGSAALTLSSGGVFSTFGTLAGGNITLKGASATLIHDITATGSLNVATTDAATGVIEQIGGRISVNGASTFNAAGNQAITLTAAANQFAGAVSLTGGNTLINNVGPLVVGAGTITGTLGATSSGAITQSGGPLSVTGVASFDASGADITLDDLANSWGGAIAMAGRNLVFKGNSAVTLAHVSATALSLTTSGAVSQAAGATLGVSGGLSVDAGSADITLANAGNSLGGTVTLKGGTTQLVTTGALMLGTLDTGSLTATAAGVTRLGNGTVDGNLIVNSGNGPVTQAAGGLSVTGTASINAGAADITLDDAANDWTGTVGLTGRDVSLTGTGAVALGAVSIQSLVLKAGGAVTQGAPLSLTGVLNVDAGSAPITLDDSSNLLGGLVTLKGGVTSVRTSAGLSLGQLATADLTVRASGPLNLGQGDVTGDLIANSGNGPITQTGALKVTGAAGFTSGSGNITLANSGNQFLGALSLTGTSVTIFNQPSLIFGTLSFNSLDATSNGAITLGSGSLSGSLTAKALGGAITQIAGGLTVAGNTTLQASTGITMTDAANHFNGTVSLSGGASALRNAGNLRLGSVATAGLTLDVSGTLDLGGGSIGGALAATSTGAITQSGALAVGGPTSLNAGGASITLGHTGNSFSGDVNLRGGTTVINSSGALNLGALDVAALTATAPAGLRLGSGTVGGNLNATSGGTISQAAGGLRVGGVATLNAGGGNIDLGDGGNAFSGAVHVTGGDVTLNSAGALHLASFTAHDLKASAGGDLDLGGGTVGGELTATTRGSKISQSAPMTVIGVANFVADGSVATLVLDQDANDLLGGIAMRGINGGSFASASISTARDLTFSGDVATLTLNSGGVLTLGGGHSTTLTAGAGRRIVLTGPLDVSGVMTLIANGGAGVDVDMAHGAGNDFNQVLLKSQSGGSLGLVQLRDDDGRRDGIKVSGDAARLEVTSAGVLDLGGGSYGSLKADTAATGAAIKQSGALSVSGLTTLRAGSGDALLDRPDNNLGSFAIESAGLASLASVGNYTINASSVSRRLELAGAGAIQLEGPLSGSGELVMKGSGSLTITSAQSFGGGTRIESGTVVLQGASAQAGSGAVQLGADGQLDLRDGAAMDAELIAKGGKVLNSSGTGTLAGAVTLQAFTTFQPGPGGLTVSGSIDDGGAGVGLRMAGTGTLTLSGSNHYSGVTEIASGMLRATGVGSLSSASAIELADGAVLGLGLDQTAGSLSGAGRIDLGSFILATGADGKSTTFSGGLDGSGGLTKLGGGRLTLSGIGAHTGATRVAAGELVLASASALNDVTAVTVDAGATLTVQQSLDLGSLAGAGVVDVQAPLLGVGSNGRSTRWDGNITGSGGLAKRGAGVFTLAGHNTLAGDLQVAGGTLQLEGGGVRAMAVSASTAPVLPITAGVDVAGGATLELLTDIDLGALTGAGRVLLNTRTLSVGASGRSGRFDGVMSGSGGLTKSGSGTLTLGGANLYTGATHVDGGTLALEVAQAIAGASALVIAAPGQVQANARQAVASLNGDGTLVLNGANLATGSDGSDSRFDGAVSGSGGLVKQGAGTLTVTGAHINSGATVIEAGTVELSGDGALGSGEIENQGELRLSRSDALVLEQAIRGSGSLVITQGQVTLNNGANNYSGATRAQGGSLITTAANRLSDASAVHVAAGAQLQLGGNETIASLQAAGGVQLAGNLTTQAEQVYTGSLTLTNTAGQTLAGTLIDASRSDNHFGAGPLGLSAAQALVTVKEALQLGDVSLSDGGRIEAGRLALSGKLQLTGGSLALVATAAPDDAKATPVGTAQVPVAGQALAIAETTVQQGAGSVITLAEGAGLDVRASGGGSVRLEQDANSFKGQLSVLSGAEFNTAWVPNAKGTQAVQTEVRVAGQGVMVGGSGIEADLIYIRADQLATVDGAKLVARMPFDEIVLGRALSAPSLTLELSPGAFGIAGAFGSLAGQPIQIEVGSTETGGRTTGPNAGYVTVLPKAGAEGSTAIVVAGPKVGSVAAAGGPAYRFFHDGASQAAEVPLVYNGVLPLTPAASGALSSINGDAEDARRARFQETVRTENVTVRLRSGVIAEVGPGRPSTQGSEGARPPELCDPAEKPALSCKP